MPPSTRAVRGGGVDGHAGERREPHQDGLVQALLDQRRRAVAGALRSDPEAGGHGGPYDGRDLGRGARQGHGGRALVGGEVPRQPRGVVRLVAGEVDLARGAEVGQCSTGLGGGGHLLPRLVGRS
ncbi:hypothetical protein [Nocardioides sp. TF02-7]|uniref:hypothetical protein n=1 Tax=Nocardioides sp. TF02-7 TaxID=2917724 RepID=UPI0023DC2094|nr:hypothetical protein [Nocardioides sp. TF02-7]